ncbi:hypothetical protein LCGC14_1725680 [marine sediment metagenome]|uniref:Uncharacterized protein n=1 Tax=marine sediment metagenome TaxID=412755 RepID=A0A0F9HYX9_9ZZZZ
MTRTYAFLDVSPECMAEVKDKLEKAGYEHAIQYHDQALVIDMHGLALRQERKPGEAGVAVPDDGKGDGDGD